MAIAATLVTPVILFALVGAIGGWLLVTARARLPEDDDPVVQEINRLLPQTQCAQCGYPGCQPYAEAVAAGEAINLCPPGGDTTVIALAELLGRDAAPVAPDKIVQSGPVIARIREAECIGCRLCLDACPVDAIVGAPQYLHTVIASDCTGCELCLPPCPVDCIDLEPLPAPTPPQLPPVQGDCIHCGECEPVCPRDLAPQMLLHVRQDLAAAETLRLDDCVTCSLCDRACPADINLTANFRIMKQQLAAQRSAGLNARRIESRYAAHETRREQNLGRVKSRPGNVADLLGSIRGELP